ncbi:pyruvate,water dikinase [Actinoalloteichus hymeniacidonis]|nr:pyruvate,water dikinase [Actinoalloteichus hymeniacidonis]
MADISVPAGYCVTTNAFRRIMAEAPGIENLLDRLAGMKSDDRGMIRTLSAEIRNSIEQTPIPADLAAAITGPLDRFGAAAAYAVRSSATAEDLPTASFAGQQDTYLNVMGASSILDHVRRCWASLFTERAVTYRLRNGFDHREVRLAVVVQRLVVSDVAGILFTADPVTSNRRVATVEAGFGLGEALVSGVVNADVYRVRDGVVLDKTIAAKRLTVRAIPAGGTREEALAVDRQREPTLTDVQAVRLVELGRRIETHFGRPQDIEWCLTDGEFQIVQSRPITTLFPIPESGDESNHVYVSVGHQQMMTDPIKPLGLSFWQLTTPRRMAEAAGRLFVDVTTALGSPASRDGLLDALGKSDPLITDALQTVLDRGDFIPPNEGGAPVGPGTNQPTDPLETDPAIVTGLIQRGRESTAAAGRDIQTRSGPELFDFIRADLGELQRVVFDPLGHRVILAVVEATWWLNDNLQAWLGEDNAADTLIQSAPNNITSEMGLALLDVADAIRPYPAVVAFLRTVEHDDFAAELAGLVGGPESLTAIRGYLDAYGMRCVGEIDITRPRWSEQPSALVPLILGNIDNFERGARGQRFEQGLQQAKQKEQNLLERLRALPDDENKAEETQRMIDRLRTFVGYREYPKYGMVSRYFIYKRALLAEADRLVRAGVLHEQADAYFLRFEELQEVVRTGEVDQALIHSRREAFESYRALTPPRVLTSDGEALAGTYRRDNLPAGALIGLPVSTGAVEGRARVVLEMTEADLEPDDILVTAFTDPSWSPLFIGIKGLVTEVGGRMTHGAVIAREYGLPAVVGVEHATRLIRDGQRIRVNGTQGYVELLD